MDKMIFQGKLKKVNDIEEFLLKEIQKLLGFFICEVSRDFINFLMFPIFIEFLANTENTLDINKINFKLLDYQTFENAMDVFI